MEEKEKNNLYDPLKQNPTSDQTNLFYQAQSSNPGNPGPNPSPTSTGGPQFNLPGKGGWGKESRQWINRYSSSVTLPIIALLILAGGIYLYTSQKEEVNLPSEGISFISEKLPDLNEETLTGDMPEEEITIGDMPTAEEIAALSQREIAETEPAQPAEETTFEEIIPEGRKENNNIIEKAVKGEGVTHLARRALKDYLEDNSRQLTNEHKIYIEDYLKDQIGSRPLEIDEEITFSQDSIKEAINASLELNQDQLNNLEEYSALVVSW